MLLEIRTGGETCEKSSDYQYGYKGQFMSKLFKVNKGDDAIVAREADVFLQGKEGWVKADEGEMLFVFTQEPKVFNPKAQNLTLQITKALEEQ